MPENHTVNREPICISKENEKRLTTRRASDLSTRRKAERYDSIILDAQFQFEFWAKQAGAYKGEGCDRASSYFEGQAHAYAQILWYVGLKPECVCSSCVLVRMDTAETILANLDAEKCARIGEGVAAEPDCGSGDD